MKKAIHKLLAVLVAACMCTSLVPAAALGAPSDTGSDSGSTGVTSLPSYDGATATDLNVFDAVGNNRATATTEVYTIIRDTNFTFENVSLGRNFTSPQNAIDMTAASESLPNGPLTATFRGSSEYYKYLWTIVEVDTGEDGATIYKPHETSATFQGPSNDTSAGGTFGTIDPEGNRIGTFVEGTVDQGASFNHSITTADGLEQDKTYLYTLYLDSNNGTGVEAKAQITVTIYADYAQMSLYAGEDSNPPSIRGYLYKPVGSAPELSAQDIGESNPIYSAIANAAGAASPACGFGTPQNLVITSIDSKPADKAAYQNDLQVHLPVPVVEDVEFKVGDSVPLFYYDPVTKEATKKTGTVVEQTDSKGNTVTVDGQPVLAVEYTLTGDLASGGADLGVWAVGYEIEVGAFSVDSSAGEGGSISPSGSNTYPVGESPKYLLYPLDGYAIKGVTLTCDGTAVSVADGTLIGNAFTFDPASYSISKGQQWTIKAEFEKPTPDQNEYSVRGTVKGVGSGTMTFTSAAPGSEPHEVAMGQTLPADGEDPIMLPSSAGVNVVFNPGLGYRLKTFTINGTPYQVNGSSYYISTLTTGITLEAEYEEGTPDPAITRDVNFEVEGGDAGHGQVMGADGAYCTSGVMTANFGGSVTLTLKPQEEYMVSKVMAYNLDEGGDPITPGTDLATQAVKDGSATDEVYNLQVNNVLQHMKIVVTFSLSDATVDIKNPTGGSINETGVKTLKAGKPLPLVITPSAGYTLGTVTLNGEDVSSYLTSRNNGAYYTVNLVRALEDDPSYETSTEATKDKYIKVTEKVSTFEVTFDSDVPPVPTYVTITTEVDPSGGGSVTPTQQVLPGQDVDIFFFPDVNKDIAAIQIGEDSATEGMLNDAKRTGKLTLLNVQNDITVKVTFADGSSTLPSKKRYTVHPSAGPGGTISPSAEVLVYEGETQKFTFIPATGHKLSNIFVNGQPQDLSTESYDKDKLTYTLTPVGDQQDITIVGTFAKSDSSGDEQPTYTVDISAGPNGQVSPSGTITVARGALVPIVIIPNDGYHVSAVWQGQKGDAEGNLIDHVGGVSNGVYSLYDVQCDTVIKVEFAEGSKPDQPSVDEDNLIRLSEKNIAAGVGVTITPPLAGSVFYKEKDTDHANIPAELTIQVGADFKLGTILLDDEEMTATEVEPGVYRLTVPKEKITEQMYLSVGSTPEKPSTEMVTQYAITLDITGNGSVSPQGVSKGVVYVESGASQTFTLLPDPGNKVGTAKVNNKEVTPVRMTLTQDGQEVVGYSYTFPSVKQDSRLEVQFVEDPTAPPAITPYEVSVTFVPGDNDKQNGFSSITTGEGAAKVLPGNSVSITFQPDSGYETHVYKGTSKEDCTAANEVTNDLVGGTLTVPNVQSNMQYVVWFQPVGQAVVYHTVTAMEAENGSIQPSGKTNVPDKGEYTFSLKGDTNGTSSYVPDKVYITRGDSAKEEIWASGTGTDVEINKATQSFTIKNIITDVTIEAEFKPGTPTVEFATINAIVDAAGGGTVAPPTQSIAVGTEAKVTITPLPDYKLKSLTMQVGAGAPVDVMDASWDLEKMITYTFTVGSAAVHEIVATFEKVVPPTPDREFFKVFINPGANGTTSPTGEVLVPAGGSLPFTIIPDDGFKVKEIIATTDTNPSGSRVTGNRFSHTLFAVTEDTNIQVVFEREAVGEDIVPPTLYTIKASASDHGSVSPAGDIKVEEGKMSMFSFVPDPGYRLSYIKVDDEDLPLSALSSKGQYTFSNVKQDHTIHGVFIEENVTADDFVTVNAAGSDGGTITPLGAKLVWKGQSAAYTIAAMYGYELSDIQLKYGVNGTPGSIFPDNGAGGKNTANISTNRFTWANGTLTLLNVQDDINIIVSFKKKIISGPETQVRYSNIKMDVGEGGTTSLPNGLSVIEALPMNGTMNVSVIPNEGYAVKDIVFTYADGSTHTTTAAEAKQIWTSGYFTLTAAQVNYECSIKVTFRKQTDDEKQQIEDGTLKPAEYRTITASALGKGQITPKGAVRVATNASITFSMIPTEGYELSALKVGSGTNTADVLSTLGDRRSYTFQPGAEDQTIQASFSLVQGSDGGVSYVLTARTSGTGGAGGTASVETQKIAAGGSGVVYFIPNDGSKLVGVGVKTGNGQEVYTEQQTLEYRVSNITADTTVTGYFELGESPIKVTMKDMDITVASAGGKVSPEGTPAVKMPAGAEQVINLFPDAGYEVDFIRVNGELSYITANIRSYSVIADRNAEKTVVEVYYKKAEGEEQDLTVTTKVTATVNGAVGGATVSPPQQTVPVGTPVTFYVKAADGKTIYAVYVDKDDKKHYLKFKGVTNDKSTTIDNANWSSVSGTRARTTGVAGEERDAAAAGLYTGGAMAAPAVYRGDVGLMTAAMDPSMEYGENGPVATSPDKKYYEYYEITIPPELLAELMDPETGEILIDIEMRDITEDELNDPNSQFITTTLYGAGIWAANAGGMVEPYGEGIMDWGSSQNVHISAFAGYYVDRITRTYTYADGSKSTPQEIPYSGGVSSGNVMVTFGEGTDYNPDTGAGKEPDRMDINVYFKRLGEASFVTVGLGDVKGPDPNSSAPEGSLVDIDPSKVTVEPSLTDENGNPKSFPRDITGNGEPQEFVFTPDDSLRGPNGGRLILDTVMYDGKPVAVSPGTNLVSVHLTANGKFDITFRELGPGEGDLPFKPVTYEVTGKVNGNGTVSSTIERKGGTATIGFQPAEGWILDQANSFDYYVDGDNPDPNAEKAKHALDPRGLSNDEGVYKIFNIDRDHRVELTFVEAVEVTIGWKNAGGYVTPNTMGGAVPMMWKKGEPMPIVVAPYVQYNVESLTVATNGSESDKTNELAQNQDAADILMNKMAEDGLNFTIKNGPAGVEVQSAQPLAQAEHVENGVLYGAASRSASSELKAENHFNYAYLYTAPITASTNVMASWVREPEPPAPTYTITAEIVPDSNGNLNGTIDGQAGPVVKADQPAGQSVFFTPVAANGYQLQEVTTKSGIEGIVQPSTDGKNVIYGPIQGDDTVYFQFAPIVPDGPQDWITRTLRTLRALAQTGDLTAPLLIGLLAVAGVAVVGATVTGRRSRKQQRAHR